MTRRTPFEAVRPTLHPLTAAIAALLATHSGVAAAQEGGAYPIEEIVVTASRRETTIQDLPFNIAALSGERLEDQRITGLTELARWVPGLTVVEQGPRSSSLMMVRGLNVLPLNDSYYLDNTSGDSVATYLGEIPLYVDFRMKDLDRVEVLLGPQGTLYGAGTLGGAVRYIPKAPDANAVSFDAHGDLYGLAHSSDNGYAADVAINVPIIEGTLAFRAALAYLDDPGFIDYPFLVREPGVSNPQPNRSDPADVAANLRRQNDVDWQHMTSGRLALAWSASDSVRATFNYYFQSDDVGGRTVNSRDSFQTGQYESGSRFVEPNDRDNRLLSAEVVADLGFATLTSATGVSSFDQQGQRDQTDLLLDLGYGYETFPSFAAFTRDVSTEDRVNEELRLVSSGNGPWGWIAGVFYNHLELDSTAEELTPGWPAFAGLPTTSDLEYRQIAHKDRTEKAVFGEVSYRFASSLTLTLGGREFDYNDELTVGIEVPFVDFTSEQTNVASDDGFLGKVNLAYEFNRNVTGYVTLSEGYRLGGVNSVAPCALPLDQLVQNVCALPSEVLIRPDTTRNLEVGMHGSLRDGDLLLSSAIYTVEWDDVQTLGETANGAVPITINGGGARSRGLEVGIQARGMEHWTVSGTYSFTNAELTTLAPGLVDGVDALPGDRLSGSPEQQGSFFVDYHRGMAGGRRFDVGYGFTFSSDVLTKIGLRSDGETLGGYAVHNASLGISQNHWSTRLYADNLFDKFAETGIRQGPSSIHEVNGFDVRRYYRDVLRPRTVGIEFRYKLGE